MKIFLATWDSPGNIVASKEIAIVADNIVEAQDKFFSTLKTLDVYQHLWKLNLSIKEIDEVVD